MADPAAAFHAAQDAALRGSTPLQALFGGVVRLYSVVPENAPLPFIRIGDDQIIEDSTDCASASDIFAAVHVWTKPDPPGVQLGRVISGVIRDTLTTDLIITGWDTVLALFVDTRHLTDPDGSSHAVMMFHYFTTEEGP
ncbi:MAG TPA: DUF3168 domain-containing protein [Caulobacteraceae bacterium]|jgi:hypothetical protein